MWTTVGIVLVLILFFGLEAGADIWDLWPKLNKHPLHAFVLVAVLFGIYALINFW